MFDQLSDQKMHKYRFGFIGLGIIFGKHLKALERLNIEDKDLSVDVVHVCDLNQENLNKSRELLEEVGQSISKCTFSTDVSELAGDENVDVVVVCTNVQSHYQVIKKLILAKKTVFFEKPGTTNNNDLEDLSQLAKSNNTLLYSLLHSEFGCELRWWNSEKVRTDEPRSFHTLLSGGCFNNKNEAEQTNRLYSCWLDIGINAISIAVAIVKDMKLNTSLSIPRFVRIPSINEGRDVQGCAEYSFGVNGKGSVETSWCSGEGVQRSRVMYSNPDEEYLFDHAKQKVTKVVDGKQEVLFSSDVDRLPDQYLYVFRDGLRKLSQGQDNIDHSLKLHNLLFSALHFDKS
ncbi:inositol 2-dehydrogenase/D-chiro-inositol 3-dehydrogenase [Acrasis kona]|uniref:Inositol 2-dehydrogenase/D-chiro-inositol 3-dehydrogenase n=1 Tax=Acrasis kona TaxID=1008807 RepID=A0AAW2Z0P2_9EUKA